ncbi:MAG: hypothetical protein KAU17_12650 [Spirochaetales bacterium]|nr:hypothetical protein [Spirochaetales bacterium]
MKKFTLDTNCIIDLEENRPNAEHVRKVVQAWKDERIELAVVAVSASENQRSGIANRHLSAFEQKLERAGLAGVQYLLPLGKWDVCYWDYELWADDEMERLESKIRGILFPSIQASPPQDINTNSVWRNQLCDVLVAWSHAFHKWDYLVTGDENFHNHKHELKKVGVIGVVYQRDAACLCSP